MDWEAVSAVGTVGAVVVALFGPAIQRRFVRKKTNALFALAYRYSVVGALGRLENLAKKYPLDPQDGRAWSVHDSIVRGGAVQKDFLEICGRLDELSALDVDMTKWVAADLDLAAKISVAIESASHFQHGAETVALFSGTENWVETMNALHLAQLRAIRDVSAASDSIQKALSAYKVTASQD
jgi:hypothetical protein